MKVPPMVFRSGQATPAGTRGRRRPASYTCRYRRQMAGASVCWAVTRVEIVTDADCRACEVPATFDRVDCYYLQASMSPGPGRLPKWICGATGRPVSDEDALDCSPCKSCERLQPRRPIAG